MTGRSGREFEELLTPGETAALFRVTAKTVAKWANAGKLSVVRTPGRHRRFRAAEIRALLADGAEPRVTE